MAADPGETLTLTVVCAGVVFEVKEFPPPPHPARNASDSTTARGTARRIVLCLRPVESSGVRIPEPVSKAFVCFRAGSAFDPHEFS
jgi:hypothetical protein